MVLHQVTYALRPAIALPDYALHAIRPAFQDGRQSLVGLPASNGIDRESANHSYHLPQNVNAVKRHTWTSGDACTRGARELALPALQTMSNWLLPASGYLNCKREELWQWSQIVATTLVKCCQSMPLPASVK